MAAQVRHRISGTGSGSTITVSSAGLTFLSGDVLVLHVWGFATLGAPTGGNTTWSHRATGDSADPFSSTITHRVYRGVAGSSIDNFTLSNGAADEYCWMLTSVSGGSTTLNGSDAAVANATYASAPAAPSVTAQAAGALLLCAMNAMLSTDGGTTFTAPGGMTEQLDLDAFYNYTMASEELSASGATGTKTFAESPDSSSTGAYWIGSSIVIEAASGASGATVSRSDMLVRPFNMGRAGFR